jgi:DNA-directed RNA polymerase I subunit RPA1
MNNFLPGKYIGSVSERVYKNLKEYIKKEESSENIYSNIFYAKKDQLTPSKFRVLFNVKYLNSLIHPGDSVGCLAA